MTDKRDAKLPELPVPYINESGQLKENVPAWVGPFITALATTGNVTLAAQAAGISRKTANERRRNDVAFAALMQDAMDEAADLLEAEVRRRAVEGVQEPVYGRRYQIHNGRSQQISDGKVGEVTKYSDTLLIFYLKGQRPEKFKDGHQQEHTGEITIKYINDWRGPGEPE
jgi:hypothetical protein